MRTAEATRGVLVSSPFALIEATLRSVDVDPDVEHWGIVCTNGVWSAFCAYVHSASGPDPVEAAVAFAESEITTCTKWRQWSDDDGRERGYTRKYKGLRVRAVRGAAKTDDGMCGWSIRVYAHNRGEPIVLLGSVDHPPLSDDDVKVVATVICGRIACRLIDAMAGQSTGVPAHGGGV